MSSPRVQSSINIFYASDAYIFYKPKSEFKLG
ncbi:unnamed protein product, partial [marine sediment metagenome]